MGLLARNFRNWVSPSTFDIVLIAAPKVFGHHIKELYVKLAFKQKRSI